MSCCQKPTPSPTKFLPELFRAPHRFWVCWPYSTPTEYMSLSDKAILQSSGIYSFKAREVDTGRTVDMFPGDLGLVGFQRDTRPCLATCCKASALIAGGAYRVWLEEKKRKEQTA